MALLPSLLLSLAPLLNNILNGSIDALVVCVVVIAVDASGVYRPYS